MILLVSNSLDLASDYVVVALRRRGVPYLRIDLDLLSSEGVTLDPVEGWLTVHREDRVHRIRANEVQSVYYRAPTHLGESSGGRYPPSELLSRHQWAAFARSLMVFDTARWVNHPWQTYRAENKPFQLWTARRLGLSVPHTRIANVPPAADDPTWTGRDRVAVKALDTFLTRMSSGEDAFFYTRTLKSVELASHSLAAMPVTFQQLLEPKLDLRVTVVGERVFSVAIRSNGCGVIGDWRLAKDSVEYDLYPLPSEVRSSLVEFTRQLGLVFAAIDLAVSDGQHYFLEANPTGEWAWLEDRLAIPIAQGIADELIAG